MLVMLSGQTECQNVQDTHVSCVISVIAITGRDVAVRGSVSQECLPSVIVTYVVQAQSHNLAHYLD